ncbi:MAG: GTP-binding protein gtr1 [Trizodia sp. TS-e1964]|nr:MAG: GTP-binding protein gtr1 [Trizodia sp. TS-e1964]
MDSKFGNKRKVLLMGKSGAGKSSMRSIIFSNYVAKDTRRLGATIDVEHSHVKFLGNLILNLWDCGGQDGFVENYLSSQRDYIFSGVGVLIYVFDIESREFDRDLVTYGAVIRGLSEFSPGAQVFCLIHKMDLVHDHFRDNVFRERNGSIITRSENFDITSFPTSIWDQSLYKAWSSIMKGLIPNMEIIQNHLEQLMELIDAEEIMLFERTTFLVVTYVASDIGAQNPCHDRFERFSNIIKSFKQSLSKFTGLPQSSPQFVDFQMRSPKFSLFICRLTPLTYALVALPPGLAKFNAAIHNMVIASRVFERLDGTGASKDLPRVQDDEEVDASIDRSDELESNTNTSSAPSTANPDDTKSNSKENIKPLAQPSINNSADTTESVNENGPSRTHHETAARLLASATGSLNIAA